METVNELFERRVLIVDDEEINRQILGNIIESEYKVAFAKEWIGKLLYLVPDGVLIFWKIL